MKKINNKLKVGIYSDAGSMTCENYQPGSYGFEAAHIALFNEWGVDMLKYDYCNSQASTKVSYTQMGDVIAKLNEQRKAEGYIPFVFNICEWGKRSLGFGVRKLAARAGAPQAMHAKTGWEIIHDQA